MERPLHNCYLSFPFILGPAYPSSLAVGSEPFSSFGLQEIYFIMYCVLNKCYYHQDLHQVGVPQGITAPVLLHTPRAASYSSSVTAIYLFINTALTRRRGLGDVLERHPFSGPIHSAGKLLHTS